MIRCWMVPSLPLVPKAHALVKKVARIRFIILRGQRVVAGQGAERKQVARAVQALLDREPVVPGALLPQDQARVGREPPRPQVPAVLQPVEDLGQFLGLDLFRIRP